MKEPMPTSRRVCPVCRAAFQVADAATHPTSPFCSERCKLADLGQWLSGGYHIPGSPSEPSAPLEPDHGGDRGTEGVPDA